MNDRIDLHDHASKRELVHTVPLAGALFIGSATSGGRGVFGTRNLSYIYKTGPSENR